MTALGPYLVGLSSTEINKEDEIRIASPNVGGLILFSRNFANKDQLIDYIKKIRASGGHKKPIFVDHEGGRVQRFKDGFTPIPAMGKLGAIAENEGLAKASSLARQVGFVLASELTACGLDMSFTPVLDIDWGRSEIIGNRAFSNDAEVITQLAAAVMHGLQLAGMQACGKHFPGHGWVKADSHLSLPIDERPLEAIEAVDMQPYKHIGSLEMAAIMPAHVVFEQVDPRPACFSEIWLKRCLRNDLGYDGAIISDDLDMVGAHGEGEITARAEKTLLAGCDAALVCNNLSDIDQLVNARMPSVALENSASRQRRLGRLLKSERAIGSWTELQKSADYLRAVEAITTL